VQRVPQYRNVTITGSGSLSANAWDGVSGGIVAFYASGAVNINNNGRIDVNGLGYRGSWSKGESILSSTSGVGGGGVGYLSNNGDPFCPFGGYGGGGGGYGTTGDGGVRGQIYGDSALNSIFLGSAGAQNTVTLGKGGGIVYVRADSTTVSSNGYIVAGGLSGSWGNGGGGGSGGSIYLIGNNISIGQSSTYVNSIFTAGGAGNYWASDDCSVITGFNGGAGRTRLAAFSVAGSNYVDMQATLNSGSPTPIYYSSGMYTSGAVQVSQSLATWGTISWMSTLSTGQSLSLRVRSADNSVMSNASAWCSVTNGSTAGCLRPGDTYLQYEVTLNNGADSSVTPSLDSLTVNFFGYTATAARPDGMMCSVGTDCLSGVCSGGTCQIACNNYALNCGSACAYSGQSYGTVQIGSQCWFSQNLNNGTQLVNSTAQPSNNSLVEKWCYNDSAASCTTWGGLYTWAEAMQLDPTCNSSACTVSTVQQGICPAHWHIPTDPEYKTLEMYLGMTQAQADALGGWRGTSEGTKLKSGGSSGFNAPFGGYRSPGMYGQGSAMAILRTASAYDASNDYIRELYNYYGTTYRGSIPKSYGLSVRCIAN
jgi:uncharacterized protein (TIGR02145 family)